MGSGMVDIASLLRRAVKGSFVSRSRKVCGYHCRACGRQYYLAKMKPSRKYISSMQGAAMKTQGWSIE